MKNAIIGTALIALALLLGAGPSLAQDKPSAPGTAAVQSAKKVSKAVKPAKLVDINSASKAELKKLPGIGDEEADRIIAGRPYRSKADLATRKIVATGIFIQIKRQIIAKQKLEPATRPPRK